MKLSKTITYEQPVNEHTRVCLRLEALFNRISQFIDIDSSLHAQYVLDSILEITRVVDRNDLKPTMVKELKRLLAVFMRLRQYSNIDYDKLDSILGQLERNITIFNSSDRKIAESLRQNDFLSAIRAQRSNPGGVCHFDVPHYFYWLQLPFEVRRSYIDKWLEELDLLRNSVNLILDLIRKSAMPKEQVAPQGMFHTALNPKTPCQMIRVMVPIETKVYPEISVGRHRVYLRFSKTTINERPDIIADDITFKLTCCAL